MTCNLYEYTVYISSHSLATTHLHIIPHTELRVLRILQTINLEQGISKLKQRETEKQRVTRLMQIKTSRKVKENRRYGLQVVSGLPFT